MQKKIIEKPEMFKNMIGEFLGYSDWKLVTQKEQFFSTKDWLLSTPFSKEE